MILQAGKALQIDEKKLPGCPDYGRAMLILHKKGNKLSLVFMAAYFAFS